MPKQIWHICWYTTESTSSHPEDMHSFQNEDYGSWMVQKVSFATIIWGEKNKLYDRLYYKVYCLIFSGSRKLQSAHRKMNKWTITTSPAVTRILTFQQLSEDAQWLSTLVFQCSTGLFNILTNCTFHVVYIQQTYVSLKRMNNCLVNLCFKQLYIWQVWKHEVPTHHALVH